MERYRSGRPLAALVLGILLFFGLFLLGAKIAGGIIGAKQLERTVTVKGLSEREVPADVAIWPIRFTGASNDLVTLYEQFAADADAVEEFLITKGFNANEISQAVPSITDNQAQGYGDPSRMSFRYVGSKVVTVYSNEVDKVRLAMDGLVELGKKGIALSGQDYQARPEFLFNSLNSIKPEMIEEATRNARDVAWKFADDSGSVLGKIRKARQGQFSISDRDSNTPHIKRVRVVSTLEYFLVD